ncbi:helix-turn-helix domain-containing protein [Pantoea eucrina]|uniref:Helix-turn-helix domain-containing protein n=1 Tax=Pantoea eucrina TaxID=472693 RepID=A0ABS1ZAG9_9GAMM|nr:MULTISPECIES: NadS family protein [Pantoea]AIX52370.1 Cro/Cl family transcriptional regulator [Pantoea sp. PSNIH1]MBM0748983.1 helix-turn-helix domain-containing protein [Pantoea eucrina]NIE72770.1 helix-turn-helix domain-containing protein [Pantoea sp. Acro-807]QNH53326.1 helix-turn-helix domain-containing protein [Acinetobacter venetianus]
MDQKLFSRLTASMGQMNEIIEGSAEPSRVTEVNQSSIKQLRDKTGLSQSGFATLISVSVDTLKNWEQGRRKPTGPAQALLRAIEHDPVNVIKALSVR